MTRIARIRAARGDWKQKVKERMIHLEEYEWSKGKRWNGERVERNVCGQDAWGLECEDCGKRCKTKAGLTVHRRRIHEVSVAKRIFQCECGRRFNQEANLKNHRRKCGDVVEAPRVYRGERGPCPQCGKVMARTNIARHIREACVGGEASLEEA